VTLFTFCPRFVTLSKLGLESVTTRAEQSDRVHVCVLQCHVPFN